jgi:hypothetical protein
MTFTRPVYVERDRTRVPLRDIADRVERRLLEAAAGRDTSNPPIEDGA